MRTVFFVVAIGLLGGCADRSTGGADVTVVVLDVGPSEVAGPPDVVVSGPDGVATPDVGVAPDVATKPDGGGTKPTVIPQCMEWKCTNGVGTCALRPLEDGTPCDDGDSCTTGAVCGGGECLAGSAEAWPDEPPALFPQTWGPGPLLFASAPPICGPCAGGRVFKTVRDGPHEAQAFDAIVEDGEGGFVVIQGRRLLTRLNAQLEPTWSKELSALPQYYHYAAAMLARSADGGYVAFARGGVPSEYDTHWLASFGPDGVREWERSFKPGTPDDVRRALPHPDGSIYIAGAHLSPTPTFAGTELHAGRLSSEGETQWLSGLADKVRPSGVGAMAWVTPDSMLISYLALPHIEPPWQEPYPTAKSRLARVTASGEVLWTQDDSAQDSGGEVYYLAVPVGSRRVLLAGLEGNSDSATPDTANHYIAVKVVDEDGALVGRTRYSRPSMGGTDGNDGFPWPSAGAPTLDGGAVVVGGLGASDDVPGFAVGTEFPFVMKVDRWANIDWIRYFGPGPDNHLGQFQGAVMSADGSMTLVGAFPLGANAVGVEPERGLIVRTDFWGRTCGMRLGVCADMPWSQCEDDDPCTANWCDPDLGCTHPVRPDGSVCGVGKTCVGGACQ
jgi:hypothetical protein